MAWCLLATSHNLNQCWPDSLTHICGTRGRLIKHPYKIFLRTLHLPVSKMWQMNLNLQCSCKLFHETKRPVKQIPLCTSCISTIHHFVTEMCTYVHISVTKWCIVGYLSNALWDFSAPNFSWTPSKWIFGWVTQFQCDCKKFYSSEV